MDTLNWKHCDRTELMEMKMQPFARSKSFGRIISELDEIIEKTADYFDDEQTAQLNITKAWLNDALITVRQHELQRLKLTYEICNLSQRICFEEAQ